MTHYQSYMNPNGYFGQCHCVVRPRQDMPYLKTTTADFYLESTSTLRPTNNLVLPSNWHWILENRHAQ